jgi:hypothetical protein
MGQGDPGRQYQAELIARTALAGPALVGTKLLRALRESNPNKARDGTSYPEVIRDIVLGGFTVFAGGVMTLML